MFQSIFRCFPWKSIESRERCSTMQLCNEFWTCREMNYQQLGKLTYNEALLGQLQWNIIEPPILNIHCFWDDVFRIWDDLFCIWDGVFHIWDNVFCIWDGVFHIWVDVFRIWYGMFRIWDDEIYFSHFDWNWENRARKVKRTQKPTWIHTCMRLGRYCTRQNKNRKHHILQDSKHSKTHNLNIGV